MADVSSLLRAFNELLKRITAETNETDTECIRHIPDDKFHFWFLLPSSLMIILLVFSFHRKNLCLTCLGGRPAAVFPMDILGKSNRMSYAAAWGAITYLVAEMVLGETHIVNLQGPKYATIWNRILSVVVIGVGYFPLFAALALDSIVSLVVAALYAFVLFIFNMYQQIFECDLILTDRLIEIALDIPNLVCIGYLCISIPVRIFQGLRRKTLRIYTSSERVSFIDEDKDLELTCEAEHVRELLRPPKPPPPVQLILKEKAVGIVKSLVDHVIYHNKHKYRYSARILTVTVMGLLLLYYAALKLFFEILPRFNQVTNGTQQLIDTIGTEYTPGEEEWITDTREIIIFFQRLALNLRICFIVAVTLALVAGILTILHMLTSYRTNLLSLYKGDNTHIPHRSTVANATLLVFSCISSVSSLSVWQCACLFFSLIWGVSEWLLEILETVWPAIMMTIILMLVQKLSARFFFLQGRGLFLAMDNRRALFSFSFFMLFYNIFIGFLSCLLRIIKSIVIGAIFLPRLDNSALPRRFQMMDPGFAAYVGFFARGMFTHASSSAYVRTDINGGEEEKRCAKY